MTITKVRYRTPKILAVLISGKAGVGKSTLAEILLDKLSEFDGLSSGRFGFAMPIKALCQQVFGWDGKKDEKGRRLLQDIGRAGRAYDKDVWARLLLEYIVSNPLSFPHVALIDDWRFPNELDFISKNLLYDVLTIRVEAPDREILAGTPEYEDVSETSLPSVEIEYRQQVLENTTPINNYKFVVDNTGTMSKLIENSNVIVESIKNNYLVQEVKDA